MMIIIMIIMIIMIIIIIIMIIMPVQVYFLLKIVMIKATLKLLCNELY